MSEIRLENLNKNFDKLPVIQNVSLTVKEKEFCVFVGPSGCGKSTLLRLIAGLEEATSGEIYIGNKNVTQTEPYHRKLSMVFQNYALYPHMNVRQNIEFALKTAKIPSETIDAKIKKVSQTLGLEQYLNRKPAALSGGQRQRVAIARAIVREPLAFLFDEPLSNLDASLRNDTRLEIAALHKSLEATTIYVTHDQVEAMTLADRIVVMKDGKIMQSGTPTELYEQPENVFVAQFLGTPKMNVVKARKKEQNIKIGDHIFSLKQLQNNKNISEINLGIRPENFSIVSINKGKLRGKILINEFHGDSRLIVVDIGSNISVTVKASSKVKINIGETVGLDFEMQKMHVFLPNGNRTSFKKIEK